MVRLWESPDGNSASSMPTEGSREVWQMPTLEELIDACIKVMEKHNTWSEPVQWHFQLGANMPTGGTLDEIGKVSEWRAEWQKWLSDDIEFPSEQNNYFGSTPVEAVANLWLALNEKK